MFEVIAKWNLSKPHEEMKDSIKNITLRGYNPETFLTGEFARKINDGDISPLSLSSIAGKYCPTRRDLYFEKGKNRLTGFDSQDTWVRKVGYVVEDYIELIMKSNTGTTCVYDTLINDAMSINTQFNKDKKNSIDKLTLLESSSPGIKEGATDWLKILLSNMGRAEMGLKLLHSLVKEKNSLDISQICLKPDDILPTPKEIGINAPATPDFIMPEFGIVGDVKTGVEFLPYFLLTCAGYALAFENSKKKDIDWGIIYFFPTRSQSEFVKPLTFAQVHIFPIDDRLREWFIDFRDEAYRIISQDDAPEFPLVNKREKCIDCRFKDHCKGKGLDLSEYE